MKRMLALIVLLLVASATITAQEKGVDQQNERIRDASTNRTPATNGGNTGIGTGRGIDFGRDRTPETVPVENPYRLTVRRDAVVQAVQELMRERKLVPDEVVSKPDEGIVISQPYTFIRGAVVAESELNRFAEVPTTTGRGWTRGRYTLIVEAQQLDGNSTSVSVNARVEGRTDGAAGAEWTTLRSTGFAEQEFLIALVEKITGAPPPGSVAP